MSETKRNMSDDNGEEPTMEEILSSIRRIISDDDEEEDTELDMAAAMENEEDDEEILELTEILAEEDPLADFDENIGLISPDDIDDLEFSSPNDTDEEPAEEIEKIVKDDILPQVAVSETLISNQVGEQVNQNFNLLANTLLAQNGAGQTVESMVMALMRPMLKGWLDDNLPVMVEKIIREEIERVARGGKM